MILDVKNYLKTADFILIGTVLAIFVALCLFRPFSSESSYVRIQTPKGTFIYPLSEDKTLNFDGLEGTSTIEIKDGNVSFTSSPCPNKICILEGSISKPGAFNACLPNGISITITGESSSDGLSM